MLSFSSYFLTVGGHGGFFSFICSVLLPLIYFLLFIHWTQFCFVLFCILCSHLSSHNLLLYTINWMGKVNFTLQASMKPMPMPMPWLLLRHCWDRFAFNWFLIDSMKWFHSYVFLFREPLFASVTLKMIKWLVLEFSIRSSYTHFKILIAWSCLIKCFEQYEEKMQKFSFKIDFFPEWKCSDRHKKNST